MSRRPVLAPAAVLVAASAALLASACSGGERLGVAGASSLREALPAYAEVTGTDARFSFTGSDEIASQVRLGAGHDVLVLADPEVAGDLRREGLIGEQRVVAENQLVLAVRRDSGIDSLDELLATDPRIGAGSPGSPFGRYTEKLLDLLPESTTNSLRSAIGTREPSLTAIIGKLNQGSIDAAFVYRSDLAAGEGKLRALSLPGSPRVMAKYPAVVVLGSDRVGEARRFVDGLLGDQGGRQLEAAGFEIPDRAGK